MGAEMTAAQCFSGSLSNQLRRGKTTAVLPDVLLQPVEQGAEIAACNLLTKIRQRAICGAEQLCGIHRAQRVRRAP